MTTPADKGIQASREDRQKARDNNKIYKGQGFRIINRNSVFCWAVAMDGIRVTDWSSSVCEVMNIFRNKVNNYEQNITSS